MFELFRQIIEDEDAEEKRTTSAQLVNTGRCPICTEPLHVVTCDACHGWPLGYCHHCGGLGKKTVCANQKNHKAD